MPRFVEKLQNQTAIIIGGTGGVGMSIATGLLEFGANVIITSSRQSKLDRQLDTLRSQVLDVKAQALAGFVCDLASASAVEANVNKLVEEVKSHLTDNLDGAPLSHFIYTAGDKLPVAQLEEITQDKFIQALQVRVTSLIVAVKAFSPLLPKSSKSSITLTCGSISEKPISGGWSMIAFIASGLNGLTRQLAADLGPVRVNCVAPGVVDTDLWVDMDPQERKDFMENMGKQLPTGSVGHADDVAESYLYLVRDTNMTGQTIHTNGGIFLT